jgi:hypothetical protein
MADADADTYTGVVASVELQLSRLLRLHPALLGRLDLAAQLG